MADAGPRAGAVSARISGRDGTTFIPALLPGFISVSYSPTIAEAGGAWRCCFGTGVTHQFPTLVDTPDTTHQGEVAAEAGRRGCDPCCLNEDAITSLHERQSNIARLVEWTADAQRSLVKMHLLASGDPALLPACRLLNVFSRHHDP